MTINHLSTNGDVHPGSKNQCAHCIRTRNQRANTNDRGYGAAHQRLRKAWARVVRAGNAQCARCHQPIEPGSEWHLDHTDDRTGYLGPSHKTCNERAGAFLQSADSDPQLAFGEEHSDGPSIG